MTKIYGIGNVGYAAPVTFSARKENVRHDFAPVQKEEKSSTHVVRNIIGLTIAVAGIYFFTSGKGKGLIKKIKDLLKGGKKAAPQSPTPATTPTVVQTGTKTATTAQNATELKKIKINVINEPRKVTNETLDKYFHINEKPYSAKDSAAAFKEYGLTDTEKALKELEKKSKPKATKTTTKKTTTKTTPKKTSTKKTPDSKTVEQPKIETPVNVENQTVETKKLQNKPTKKNVANETKKPNIEKDATPASNKVELTTTPKTINKSKTKTQQADYEPSKTKVIRQHSNMTAGEKVAPRSNTNSRKIRHNKKQIIEKTLEEEQKYTYPKYVDIYEKELAAKKKAQDIEKAWAIYEAQKYA